MQRTRHKYVAGLIVLLGSIFDVKAQNDLVAITQINGSIKLDIKYATTDNFTKSSVYSCATCYLLCTVARQLDNVQKELQEMGLGLLIWDGYRPLGVQKIFWDLVPDERYVANPALGSLHNRGCAVDCTLVKNDGSLLEMPTGFDDFSCKAHRGYEHATPEAKKNRAFLESIMGKHGFVGLSTEWWHFDYKEWQEYPLLDIPFEALAGTYVK
jgi:D-alanyl-D-alanine dipeptidase